MMHPSSTSPNHDFRFIFLFPFTFEPLPSLPPPSSTPTLSLTHATPLPHLIMLLVSPPPTHTCYYPCHHQTRPCIPHTHHRSSFPFHQSLFPMPHITTPCLMPHGATPHHALLRSYLLLIPLLWFISLVLQ